MKKTQTYATAYLLSLVAVLAGLLFLTPIAQATDRLTDDEVEQLLGNIESNRASFEAALDQQLKNSVIRGPRGEVNTNEFFDDLQDQVQRTRERFDSDYSASSEVIALLDYASRLDRWASAQASGFKGSTEWNALSTDLRRLAAAFNTTMPMPANGLARHYNDSEVVTAAANVAKLCDPFKKQLEASLMANKAVTPEVRQSNLQQVDNLKSYAQALSKSLDSGQKGIAEADMVIKQGLVIVAWISKNPISSSASAAWSPLRTELGKVALSYEVNNKNLPVQ